MGVTFSLQKLSETTSGTYALQKESFCTAKRVLLLSKRSPFAHQNESFCKPKGVLLKIRGILVEELKERS